MYIETQSLFRKLDKFATVDSDNYRLDHKNSLHLNTFNFLKF